MTIKIQNIYKLFTKEDTFNIHKVLGVACLCNFVYQFTYLALNGQMNLRNNKFTPLLLLMHGFLSSSSLIFHVPLKRHSGLPIINKEIRLHSIIFGLRSVICSLLLYNNVSKLANILIINITMLLADFVTRHLRSTTTTMRDMPFGKNLTEEEQKSITLMHSYNQFSATIFTMINVDTAFAPLVAIQLAVFLMTLVRKSIIKEIDWHRIYAISLWINIFLLWTIDDVLNIGLIAAGSYGVGNARIKYRINKYLIWNLVLCSYYLLLINNINYYLSDWIKSIIINFIIVHYLIKNINRSKALWF